MADCLPEINGPVEANFANRTKKMKDDEVGDWVRTYNLHRERHPLIRIQHERSRQLDGLPLRSKSTTPSAWYSPIPAPTAVHISVIKS
jgi:hypothetical protein